MKVLFAVVMVLLFAGPVMAQQAVPSYGEPSKDKTPQEKTDEREAEKAYQRSLSNIPAKAATDPWGTVRSENPPKPAKGSVAKRPPAGGTPN